MYKIKKGLEQEYQDYVAKNQDSYGNGVVRYSLAWAIAMETQLADGKNLVDIAHETGHTADTEGITGYMYGCSVQELSHYWIHGEELRQWHNLDIQIGNEGEEANEKETILNPAIICFSKSGK